MADPKQEWRATLNAALELSLAYRDSLRERRVAAPAGALQMKAALQALGELPEQGLPATQVLAQLSSLAEPGLSSMAGPRFFGWVTGGSLPAAVGAEWLTTAWDQNAGPVGGAPAANAFEACALGWLTDLLGLPSSARGALVSGCSAANFAALAGARTHVLASAGWDVERDGLGGAPAVRIYVGQERHESIDRALRLLGFGKRAVRFLPCDAQGRARSEVLRKELDTGAGPVIVCAQLGNVNSGACDPLPELTQVLTSYRARHGEDSAWLHVDGAFGLWLRASRSLRKLAEGAELADSWASDAHKVLQVPYDSGIFLTRHVRSQRRAMAIQGAYLASGQPEAGPTSGALIPELSRRARGFAVWAALRSLGRRGVEAWVDRAAYLARLMAEQLTGAPGLKILNRVDFNQVVIAATPPAGVEAEDFTTQLVRAIQDEGTAFLTPTFFQGRPALRVSVMNLDTTERDIRDTARAITLVYEALLANTRTSPNPQ